MALAESPEMAAAELEDVGEILRLYTKALTGYEIRLLPRTDSSMRGVGWATPAGDGKALSLTLPAKIERFTSKEENFAWYKIIVTHQAAHAEFGTLTFSLLRPSTLFHDWRPALRSNSTAPPATDDRAALGRLFPDPAMGLAIFDCIEDARVDGRMLQRYPGLESLYRRVALRVLAERPRLNALPLREALLEGLLQAGLGGAPLTDAPQELRPDLSAALALLARLNGAGSTVEDAAEAALRIYEIAAALPNSIPDQECAHDHERQDRHRRADDERAPDRLAEPVSDPRELPFHLPLEVEFRLQTDDAALDRREPNSNDRSQPGLADSDSGGPLQRDEPFSYLYPEWDFRAGAFKERWCRVRERLMEEGRSDFYTESLREHRWLIGQVRARFEHFLPELFRKMTRRYDGEDIQIDQLIERVVDCRAGVTPSEKIYWRRERTQRDVAVALLLDMSATTNEYLLVQAPRAIRPTTASARSYSDYLRRIASGLDDRGKPLRKRAIDIEKEAAIVLLQALETIGDSYAVYAFSGSGRANVEFHVVKDFAEPLTERVARRLDSVAPAHATRMGAAIRHAARKLERVEAQTKLLFLVSDGRPYDRDYGRDAQDQEYAVHDTRQALRDAARRRIRPFCLTIDEEGADYMRAMCEDLPYEIVNRVEDLPMRLITAYPKLTA